MPEDKALFALEDDYENMNEDGLFAAEPPGFSDLMADLKDLELQANSAASDEEQVSA